MPGTTTVRIRIASHEQQLHAGKENLKARESDLLCHFSAVDEQVRTVSSSVEACLKRQSLLEQEMISIWIQLSVTVRTSTDESESKLASICGS